MFKTTITNGCMWGILIVLLVAYLFAVYAFEDKRAIWVVTSQRWENAVSQNDAEVRIEKQSEPTVNRKGEEALFIKTIPRSARVRIMNIVPPYTPGMLLPAGEYDIEVSAPGFPTQRGWYTLEHGSQTITIILER